MYTEQFKYQLVPGLYEKSAPQNTPRKKGFFLRKQLLTATLLEVGKAIKKPLSYKAFKITVFSLISVGSRTNAA